MKTKSNKLTSTVMILLVGVVLIEIFDQVSVGVFFMMWANNIGNK